ncbi:MAG: dihydrofolate reductase [Maricaulis sp.]|jgi:dihydrofolate reductase|nr:dihydrofolate reductase [Maricaulis sp.]HAQ34829.1 dihydrofolate reductase [Alphaproteobacteria bacterium]|tara:strand:- start:185 stop:694 length:510 start_codon:yes stop_codon:yes gene_type:complete
MIRIALVVARARNGVIGRDGDLPWRLKSDMAFFKAITMGKPIVMGRKTWESLPRKPLPGRLNLVVTRQDGLAAEGAEVCSTVNAALDRACEQAAADGVEEVCVIGGAQIYAATLDRADRLYITEVEADPDGDAVFPALDPALWSEVRADYHQAGEGDDHAFTVRTLERR